MSYNTAIVNKDTNRFSKINILSPSEITAELAKSDPTFSKNNGETNLGKDTSLALNAYTQMGTKYEPRSRVPSERVQKVDDYNAHANSAGSVFDAKSRSNDRSVETSFKGETNTTIRTPRDSPTPNSNQHSNNTSIKASTPSPLLVKVENGISKPNEHAITTTHRNGGKSFKGPPISSLGESGRTSDHLHGSANEARDSSASHNTSTKTPSHPSPSYTRSSPITSSLGNTEGHFENKAFTKGVNAINNNWVVSENSSASPPLFPVMVEDEELLGSTRLPSTISKNTGAFTGDSGLGKQTSSVNRTRNDVAIPTSVLTSTSVTSYPTAVSKHESEQESPSRSSASNARVNVNRYPLQDLPAKISVNSVAESNNSNTSMSTSRVRDPDDASSHVDTILSSSPPAFPVIIEDEDLLASIMAKGAGNVGDHNSRYKPGLKPGTDLVNGNNGTKLSAGVASAKNSDGRLECERKAQVNDPGSNLAKLPSGFPSTPAGQEKVRVNGTMNSRAETRADLNARQAKSIDSKQPSVSITTSRSVSELRNRYDNVISPSTKKVSPATSAPPLSVVANHELSIPPPSPISTTPAASTSSSAINSPSTTDSSSTSLAISDSSNRVSSPKLPTNAYGADSNTGELSNNRVKLLNYAIDNSPPSRLEASKDTRRNNSESPIKTEAGCRDGDSKPDTIEKTSKSILRSTSNVLASENSDRVALSLNNNKTSDSRQRPQSSRGRETGNMYSSPPAVPPKSSLPSSPRANLPNSKPANSKPPLPNTSKPGLSSANGKQTLPPPPPQNIYGSRRAGTPLQVIVVGGGIGGLSAAYTLSQGGHAVTVLEAAKRLGEVGAGLQVSPNVSKLLTRWGCGEPVITNERKSLNNSHDNNLKPSDLEYKINERLSTCAVEPEALVFRRYNDGAVVGRSEWGEKVRKEFGAPYLHMHRADLHRILLDNVRASSSSSTQEEDHLRGAEGRVTFRLNSRVQRIDPFPSSERNKVAVELKSGEVYEGDFIVGADGVHSLVRESVVGRLDLAQRTGDAAYRAVISTERMLSLSYELDALEQQEGTQKGEGAQIRQLIETPEMTTWMGPGRHIMAYCIRAKQEYNLVMLYPDDGAEESYTAEGSIEKMIAEFENFEPRVKYLLSLIERPLVWRLDEREALKSWVHPAGRVVLLGDACHPMLPYRAQGAAMAIEDAAVLGSLLSRLTGSTGPSQSSLGPSSGMRPSLNLTASPVVYAHLTELLHAYEKLRLRRTKRTQEMSRLNRYIFHLPDGPEQEARDTSMRRAMKAEEKEREIINSSTRNTSEEEEKEGEKGKNLANANQWADGAKNREQYAYDADEAANSWWMREGEDRLRVLLQAHGLGDSRFLSDRGEEGERGTVRSNGSKGSESGGGGKRGFWKKMFGAN